MEQMEFIVGRLFIKDIKIQNCSSKAKKHANS